LGRFWGDVGKKREIREGSNWRVVKLFNYWLVKGRYKGGERG